MDKWGLPHTRQDRCAVGGIRPAIRLSNGRSSHFGGTRTHDCLVASVIKDKGKIRSQFPPA